MPPSRFTVKKPTSETYRGWAFVLVVGFVLAIVAIFDRGGVDESTADGSTDCQLTVVADELNVRTGTSVDAELVDTLTRGEVVDGTRVVVDGFRELEGERWAADQFLSPLPNTSCA